MHLAGNVEAEEGATTTLLLDFNVDASFVIQGPEPPPTGGTVQSITFLPVIREVSRAMEEED